MQSLARSLYFLRVLNEEDPAQTRWDDGQDVETLRQLLLQLAAHLRDNTRVPDPLHRRVSDALTEYGQVVFHVDFPEPGAGPFRFRPAGGAGGFMKHAELRGFITARSAHPRATVYLEAIVSLLEACEAGPLYLRTCWNCGAWYVPYSRAKTHKFCSPRCRTRFHYRVQKGATFVCDICRQESPLQHFSGLLRVRAAAGGDPDFQAGGADDPHPLCITCAVANVPEGWQEYLESVTYGRLD